MKFGVCRLRLCGGESPICAFEEESAGANQGDQLTRAGTSARPYRDFPKKFNGTTSPQARHRRRRWGRYRSGRKGPAVAEQVFEVRVTAGSKTKESSLMGNQRQINDRERRKASITRLATRIGMTLCQSEYRHLGENEWARLDRMRLELGALRAEAGL